MKDLREHLSIEPDPDAVAARAAALVVEAAQQAVRDRGRFVFVLTGGSSPRGLYATLAQQPARSALPWASTDVFFGDDRAVPPDHPESNYKQAQDVLLSNVPVDRARVHRIEGERADLEQVAREYEDALRRATGAHEGGPVVSDVLLLGVGGDGHILSLYPGCPEIDRPSAEVVALRDPPMNPALSRVTLTPSSVHHARHVIVLVHGAGKANALRAMVNGEHDPDGVPAQLVREARGRVSIVCDRAASAGLGG